MNYWWFEGPRGGAEPFGAMVHGLLAVAALPAEHRELWRKMFDHYVFRTNGDPAPYLPPERRGILGPLVSGARRLHAGAVDQVARKTSSRVTCGSRLCSC